MESVTGFINITILYIVQVSNKESPFLSIVYFPGSTEYFERIHYTICKAEEKHCLGHVKTSYSPSCKKLPVKSFPVTINLLQSETDSAKPKFTLYAAFINTPLFKIYHFTGINICKLSRSE